MLNIIIQTMPTSVVLGVDLAAANCVSSSLYKRDRQTEAERQREGNSDREKRNAFLVS